MGAKSWMLVYSDSDVADVLSQQPSLDRARSRDFAQALFPNHELRAIEEGNLFFTAPRDKDLYVGCFPGVSILAAWEFALDNPSNLPKKYLDPEYGRIAYLHAMHSVVDWAAFAMWCDGKLVRSLSLSPDHGVVEDIGERLEFEKPYWRGDHPAIDPADDDPERPYPFAFHPLDLGEAALLALFGYELEGAHGTPRVNPEDVPLIGFRRVRRRWWKFWR